MTATLYRLETRTVSTQPPPGYAECGATEYARTLAATVCRTLDGATWRAQIRAPYMPHPQRDDRQDIAIAVDRRWLVVVTRTVPAGTFRDLWRITVNARPIPHSAHPRELASDPQAIARSISGHLRRVPADPCHTIGCDATPTVAALPGWALCEQCADRYVMTGF